MIDTYRRKAEALLKRAAEAQDMRERGLLIDEALHWHNLAMDAAGHADGRVNDNVLDFSEGEDRQEA